MTAESFAELVHARRAGRGRWTARCPAHEDGSPSLSIAEGRDGRVLLNCFAGCSPTSILEALSLSIRDLFAGEPLTPQQLAVERAEHDRIRKLESLVKAIGAKLARSPDDAELGRLFHLSCDRLHDAELAAQNERPVASGPVLERIA